MTSEGREPSLPGVPTVAEAVPGCEATAWFGNGMPKGTPRDVIDAGDRCQRVASKR